MKHHLLWFALLTVAFGFYIFTLQWSYWEGRATAILVENFQWDGTYIEETLSRHPKLDFFTIALYSSFFSLGTFRLLTWKD